MSFITPVIAAVLQASSQTIDKVTLNIKKVTYKNYTAISFPLIFIFNLIIFLIFRPELSLNLFSGIFLPLLIVSVILGIGTNIIYYKALKKEKLGEMQTIGLLNRVPLILFAGLFFIDERNPVTITLALVSAFAIVWSHWEKHHFHLAKRTWPFLIWTLAISPFGGLISKKLLEIWNPISLQLVISAVEAIVFFSIFRKSLAKTPGKAIPFLIATNLLTSIAWILYFFSYKSQGIVFTVLVFSIQPLLTYFASLFLLKEKPHWKKITAFIIVLASIAISQIF